MLCWRHCGERVHRHPPAGRAGARRSRGGTAAGRGARAARAREVPRGHPARRAAGVAAAVRGFNRRTRGTVRRGRRRGSLGADRGHGGCLQGMAPAALDPGGGRRCRQLLRARCRASLLSRGFIEPIEDDETIQYYAASGLLRFLRELLLGTVEPTGWPFDEQYMAHADPAVSSLSPRPCDDGDGPRHRPQSAYTARAYNLIVARIQAPTRWRRRSSSSTRTSGVHPSRLRASLGVRDVDLSQRVR